jgi:hypothetical protein
MLCITNDLEVFQVLISRFSMSTKGWFTQWPKVERRRNSNNLIGGEPKFVFWTFTREAIAQRRMPSKMPTWQYFLKVLAPRVSPIHQEFGQDENGNPNYGREEELWSRGGTMVERRNYGQEEELWHQEFFLSAKNIGSLGDGYLLGRPPCKLLLLIEFLGFLNLIKKLINPLNSLKSKIGF